MAKKKAEKMQNEVAESANKIWLAGLGALASAEQEGSKIFKNLVEKGEKFEARGKEKMEKTWGRVKSARGTAEDTFENTFDKLTGELDDRVSATLKKLGVPSRNEIKRLTKRVEELNKKVDQLKPKPAARKTTKKVAKSPSRKTPSRKTASRKTAARKTTARKTA